MIYPSIGSSELVYFVGEWESLQQFAKSQVLYHGGRPNRFYFYIAIYYAGELNQINGMSLLIDFMIRLQARTCRARARP